MMRLSQRELPSLPRTVRRPDVDRAALHTSIVRLGLGAFARAHLAAFTQPLLAADPFWGILGVSLRSPATRDALAPQDFLYTCAARDGSGISLAIMSVLTGILVAPESPAVVVAAMADLAVRIASISVSERGYHRRAADGALDEEDALIRQDLRQPNALRTGLALLPAIHCALLRQPTRQRPLDARAGRPPLKNKQREDYHERTESTGREPRAGRSNGIAGAGARCSGTR